MYARLREFLVKKRENLLVELQRFGFSYDSDWKGRETSAIYQEIAKLQYANTVIYEYLGELDRQIKANTRRIADLAAQQERVEILFHSVGIHGSQTGSIHPFERTEHRTSDNQKHEQNTTVLWAGSCK